MRESTFRDQDFPPYPTDTTIKAVILSSKDKGSNPSFCEGWIARRELPDGDVVVYVYMNRRLFRFIMNLHSFYSMEL